MDWATLFQILSNLGYFWILRELFEQIKLYLVACFSFVFSVFCSYIICKCIKKVSNLPLPPFKGYCYSTRLVISLPGFSDLFISYFILVDLEEETTLNMLHILNQENINFWKAMHIFVKSNQLNDCFWYFKNIYVQVPDGSISVGQWVEEHFKFFQVVWVI